jgi:hypothetical protein
MAQHSIRFRIRPDGRVEEQVEGVQGLFCEQLTARIEAFQVSSVEQPATLAASTVPSL